jgi:Domain of unknown function (DUF1330)
MEDAATTGWDVVGNGDRGTGSGGADPGRSSSGVIRGVLDGVGDFSGARRGRRAVRPTAPATPVTAPMTGCTVATSAEPTATSEAATRPARLGVAERSLRRRAPRDGWTRNARIAPPPCAAAARPAVRMRQGRGEAVVIGWSWDGVVASDTGCGLVRRWIVASRSGREPKSVRGSRCSRERDPLAPVGLVTRSRGRSQSGFGRRCAVSPAAGSDWTFRTSTAHCASSIANLSGTALPNQNVVIEFPDEDTAMAWYRSDEYQAIRPIRLSASSSSQISLLRGWRAV